LLVVLIAGTSAFRERQSYGSNLADGIMLFSKQSESHKESHICLNHGIYGSLRNIKDASYSVGD
jgi:hypothetical protein